MTFKEARKAFGRVEKPVAIVTNVDWLDQKQEEILAALVSNIPYFGAIALNKDEGLFVDWLQAAAQHHDAAAARSAALAHCEASKKPGSSACIVVLEVRAAGQGEQTLSAPAAEALRTEYRKLRAPKAFAISRSTGNFGFARGDAEAALTACETAGTSADDCTVLVAD
ncbi:5-aminolevulic acid synthase [Litoreibacter roseus]|nr:5-aminolevulic acid synthase [Litoreibacter roseus]